MHPALQSILNDQAGPLAGFPASEIEHVVGLVEVRSLGRGDAFLDAGAPSTSVGVVVSGLMKLHGTDHRGIRYVVDFVSAGGMVSDYVAAVARRPANLTIEALEPTTIAALDLAVLPLLYERHPCWAALARRTLEFQLERLARKQFEFLTMTATERYQSFVQARPEYASRLSRQDLAAFLGITPASFSRLTAQLHASRRTCAPASSPTVS